MLRLPDAGCISRARIFLLMDGAEFCRHKADEAIRTVMLAKASI